MNKLFFITVFLLFLLLGNVNAALEGGTSAPMTPPASPSFQVSSPTTTYCTDFFTNRFNLVTSQLTNGTTYTTILADSLFIVLMVLVVLSVVYGIGTGFGINKLQEFARAEYLESGFNIVLIGMVSATLAWGGNFISFFGNLAGSVLASSTITSAPSTTTPTTTASTQSQQNFYTVYEKTCENLANSEVFPSTYSIISILANLIPYEVLKNTQVSFEPTFAGGIIPGFSIRPLLGLDLIYQVTVFEMSTFFIFIFLGVTLIFVFYIIYFLFPIFLYAGILFRSFPWTRAAGGSFLALFISFYIVFPLLFYPFSTTTQVQQSSCASASGNAFLQTLCKPVAVILVNLGSLISTLLGYIGAPLSPLTPSTSSGGLFIANVDIYVYSIVPIVLELVGFGIAFIISFDLLEFLGDLLGSPSLQAGRLLEKLI